VRVICPKGVGKQVWGLWGLRSYGNQKGLLEWQRWSVGGRAAKARTSWGAERCSAQGGGGVGWREGGMAISISCGLGEFRRAPWGVDGGTNVEWSREGPLRDK